MVEEKEQLQVFAASSRSLDGAVRIFTALTAHRVQRLLD
jgi:hypothetical protein